MPVGAQWETLELEPASLREAMLELHWAVQLIAATGQTFVEPRDDDSHRSMTWNPDGCFFVGEPFGSKSLRVAVRVPNLMCQLLGPDGRIEAQLRLEGNKLEEAYTWLAQTISMWTGRLEELERPEYDLPPCPVAEGAPFSVAFAEELADITRIYGNAYHYIDGLAWRTHGAAPVRAWPHHFDIATLITVAPGDGAEVPARTMGVGLAPRGGGYDDWYFYVTPYPWPEAEKLPTLDPPGFWHTEGWVGAVLRGARVIDAGSGSEQAVRVQSFVERSMAASRIALDLPGDTEGS